MQSRDRIAKAHRRLVSCLTAGMVLTFAAVSAQGALVLLDGESLDSGQTATNKLGASGVTFNSKATVDSTPADAKFGSGSFSFTNGQSTNPTNKLELLDTQSLGTQFTLAAEIKLSAVQSYQRIFESGSGASLLAFQVWNGSTTHTSQIGFYVNGGYAVPMGAYGLDSTNAATNVYHDAVITFDNGAVTIYWDGAQIATGTAKSANAPALTTNLFIAGDSYNPSTYTFNGNMDDIVVYNKALTAQQVLYMYQHGADALLVPEPASLSLLVGACVLALAGRRRRVV